MEGCGRTTTTALDARALTARTRIFKNALEYNSFFRVGQHIRRKTPCVNTEILNPEFPVVFEEWQLKYTRRTEYGISRTYCCRRARFCRRRTGFIVESNRKRKMNARGYTGCHCLAKFTAHSKSEGSFPVKVVFKNTHNHDVQFDMLNFINPIRCCRPVREMVDAKLYAGVDSDFGIRQSIHDELLINRRQHDNFFQFRNFAMAIALNINHVRNRRRSLNLDGDALILDNDANAVEELLKTWTRDMGEDSPVVYFKQIGESNSNTDDTDPDSDFKSEDFLLVMQSPEQANMMVENAQILCVDGTHGLTGYGYHLLSIVVVDKHGHGLVCAWALASRENKSIWQLVGESLRPVTKEIEPQVLMSDDKNSAWNGLTCVWPSLKHKLLCHWHLKRNVRKRCMAYDKPCLPKKKRKTKTSSKTTRKKDPSPSPEKEEVSVGGDIFGMLVVCWWCVSGVLVVC